MNNQNLKEFFKEQKDAFRELGDKIVEESERLSELQIETQDALNKVEEAKKIIEEYQRKNK